MRSSAFFALISFACACIVIGCGGGGGGSSSGGGNGGGGGNAPLAGQYLEFVGVSRSGNLDPLSLVVGDDIQVVVANYDSAGNRTVLPANGWVATPLSSRYSMSTGGRLRILSGPVGVFNVAANTKVSGQTKKIDQDCAVPSSSSLVITGKVVQESSTKGIKYVQVNFYDGSGGLIAAARTGDNGTYRGLVPSNTKSASIKKSTVPAPPFYRSFVYNKKTYTMDSSTCPLKLGTLSSGQDNVLANMGIYLQENGPPPPPDGCKP